MGSEFSSIRSLLVNQIDVKLPDVNTNPSSTLLNTYINRSVREITRVQHPEEMKIADPVDVATVAGANSAIYPATMYIPDLVYFKTNNGKYRKLRPKKLEWIINHEGQKYFDGTNNISDPDYYSVRGGKILTNKYFLSTDATGMKVFGLKIPTVLVNDSDACDLTIDWDMAIIYKAAEYFYQRDDDIVNQQKYERLYLEEVGHLALDLDFNEEDQIDLDPYTFIGGVNDIRDPGTFFQ